MEEEITMAETEQGDVASNEGESTVEKSNNSPVKRGRGRPQGSKKLKVSITDVNLVVSGLSNGGSTQSPRKRGRPKLVKHTEPEASGDDQADDSEQTSESKKEASNADNTPKKRGRPRKSDVNNLPNGGSDTPKAKRGRPKGSTKRKSESLTSDENEDSSVTRRKPRGSLNKKPRLERERTSVGREDAAKPRRGRGRPRKVIVQESDSQPAKRGRGRPKGSFKTKPPAYKVSQPKRSPSTKGKRGRPRKEPAKRGRPRKYPLPSPEELKKPRVWKPLGRPRKYPRVDPPEGSLPAPRRSRGRPSKAESKKGAHLRKTVSSSSPTNPNVGPPRKRGRPPKAPKSDAGTPGRRGRPKGSVNKNKAKSETQLDSELPNHSKADSDSSPAGVEHESVEVEEKVEEMVEEEKVEHVAETTIEQDSEATIKHDTEMLTEQRDNTEESLIDQDASFEVSNQA